MTVVGFERVPVACWRGFIRIKRQPYTPLQILTRRNARLKNPFDQATVPIYEEMMVERQPLH